MKNSMSVCRNKDGLFCTIIPKFCVPQNFSEYVLFTKMRKVLHLTIYHLATYLTMSQKIETHV